MDQQGNPTFDLIGGILGRTDDMVVVRGVNLYPASVDAVIRRFNQVREYRVYKENAGSMVEIKIKVEAEPEIAKLVETGYGMLSLFAFRFNQWRRENCPVSK